MRFASITAIVIAMCLITLVNSFPASETRFRSKMLERVMVKESNEDPAARGKRTIGILRQFFPSITKIIETKVNSIVSQVIKILGPTVLRTTLNNGGQNKSPEDSSRSDEDGSLVTAASPFDDEELLEEDTETDKANEISSESDATNTKSSEPQKKPEEQDASVAESNHNEVKVQFADQDNLEAATDSGDLPPLEEIEVPEDENRNKRFLSFGFGGSGAAGGSGGGSGNFLFDIIRQAADGAARAAGTVYRVVAGTQSLGLGLSASRDLAPSPTTAASAAPAAPATPAAAPAPGTATQPSLVAGSGSASSDGSSTVRTEEEAVPGPITRLFVIANRGISNLVQDIILRLAATSERIVNFKARLITSII
ncbi:GSCOCG00002490001-RA-CDS [Cotesia congregata]|nr:GSCOCG00002490001-RA-CDS [Cotesia congregata]